MTKSIFLFFLIFVNVFLFGQANQWSLVNTYANTKIKAWDIDPMGKLIFAKNDAITKLDTSFQVRFTQSVKSFGEVTKIDARHSLKTLLFSEEQQAIAFVDNTLTMHKGMKDLSKLNISFATTASYSAQTNRYWIFDGDNSTLVLIDEIRNRPQTLENLGGIVGAFDITDLMEMENVLLLFDKSKGIYLFDVYGSLIDFIETTEARAIHFSEGVIYYITDKELVSINTRNRNQRRIQLPEENIDSFRVLGSYFYFKTPQHIRKYLLKKRS